MPSFSFLATRKFALTGMALLCAGAAGAWWWKQRPLGRCTDYADPVRVKVGDVLFHIPADYDFTLSDWTGFFGKVREEAPKPQKIYDSETSDNYRIGYCQAKDDDPFEVPDFFLRYEDKERGIKSAFSVQLHSVKRIKEHYCEAEYHRNSQNKQPYEANPLFTRIEEGDYSYSILSETVTLFGRPVKFGCSRKDIVSAYEDKTINYGKSCTIVHSISEKERVRFRLHTKNHPPDTWPNLIKATEQKLLKLVPAIPKPLLISCNSE